MAQEKGSKDKDSRRRLIDAATGLFISKGYRGVSIREIASAAGANSALIAYYFEDKEGLFKHVFKEVAGPLNAARMRNFDMLEGSGRPVRLEDVMRAWLMPMFEENRGPGLESPVAALSLSLNAEYGRLAEQISAEVYDEVNDRFLASLERCLEGVSRATLVWRLHFLIGAVLTVGRPHGKSFMNLSGGTVDGNNAQELIEQLVAFSAAGFRALEPASARPGAKPRRSDSRSG